MRYLLIMVALAGFIRLNAQDARLAQQYFQNGEYEKAASLYEKLFAMNESVEYYFDRYVDCLLAIQAYDECEKLIKRQLKKDPKNVNMYVSYGKLLERQYREEEAQQQYRTAISNMPKEPFVITKLANAFVMLTRYDLAVETYEKGAALLRDPFVFAYNLGELYRRKGDTAKMIDSYLNALSGNADRLGTIQTVFQRHFLNDDFDELQKQLYARLQQNENATYYVELLAWVFIQRKDYKNALRQVRALDRRLRENGGRVYQLAEVAASDKDYDAAIDGYEYVAQKGIESPYYMDARREALRCKRSRIVEGYDYTREQLLQVEKEYEQLLKEFGRSAYTASIILELAELQAIYINNIGKAIALLTEMIEYPNVDRNVQAMAKLNLGDYYLIIGEVWDATLLYSQVDKAFKEDVLGHDARFRNARLSYFSGDFQWAQAQFDILKSATSRLIANDAIDMSVFIMDNMGLDTTTAALKMYAEAELLVFQNRFEEAFAKLETLLKRFPKHFLEDDVFYLKANIYIKQRAYDRAAVLLEKIVTDYNDSIRADNALFQLAQLYETHLNDIGKAKELYETLFIDYSGSTFAVEARKRFRILRGDNIQ